MPRKRAKLSARQAQRDALGHDLAPEPKNHRGVWGDTPRRAMELFRGPPPKKRTEEETSKARASSTPQLQIKPGERIKDFNQYVHTKLTAGAWSKLLPVISMQRCALNFDQSPIKRNGSVVVSC